MAFSSVTLPSQETKQNTASQPSQKLPLPTKNYYHILGASRRDKEMLFSATRYPAKAILCLMSKAIEEGQTKPLLGMVYVKPGASSFSYTTSNTPVLAGKPQLQEITQQELRMNVSGPFTLEKIQTVTARVIEILREERDQLPFLLSSIPSINPSRLDEQEEARAVLSSPDRRQAYDDSLDAYFQKIYNGVKQKNVHGLRVLLGNPAIASTQAEEKIPTLLGFEVINQDDEEIVECLGREKDKASLAFLAEHFRSHFSTHQLAFMGADVSPEEIRAEAGADATPEMLINKNSGLAYEYARGDHPKQVDKMIALFPDADFALGAISGYVLSGNAAGAEKMLAITHDKKQALNHLEWYFHIGRYLKDPKKLTSFLASASPQFRSVVVTAITQAQYRTRAGASISDDELNVQKNLAFYADMARQLAASEPAASTGKGQQPDKDKAPSQ